MKNDTPSLRISRSNFLIFLAGIASLIIGTMVLYGWLFHIPILIQIYPEFAAMQVNTAIGFLGAGLGILFIFFSQRILSVICGIFILTLGLLTLYEYVFNQNLGVDQLILEHYITTKTSHPGRMAPNTAISFILTGLLIILIQIQSTRLSYELFTKFLAFSLLIIGLNSLLGYGLTIESFYGWTESTRMAIHTSLLFFFLGLGFSQDLFTQVFNLNRLFFSLALLSILLATTLIISSWQIIFEQEKKLITTATKEELELIKQHIQSKTDFYIFQVNTLDELYPINSTPFSRKILELQQEFINTHPKFIYLIWIGKNENDAVIISKTDRDSSIPKEILSGLNFDSLTQTKAIGDKKYLVISEPLIRQGKFRYKVAVLPLSAIIQQNIPSAILKNNNIVISSGSQIIYKNIHSDISTTKNWQIQESMSLSGQNWTVTIWPTEAALENKLSYLPEVILLVGSLLTVCILIVINLIHSIIVKSNEIQKNKQQLELIFDYAADGIIETNSDGIITFANPAAYEILGYHTHELHGTSVLSLIENPDLLINLNNRDNNFHKVTINSFYNKRGKQLFIDCNIKKLKNANPKSLNSVIVFRDITDYINEDRVKKAIFNISINTDLKFEEKLSLILKETTEYLKVDGSAIVATTSNKYDVIASYPSNQNNIDWLMELLDQDFSNKSFSNETHIMKQPLVINNRLYGILFLANKSESINVFKTNPIFSSLMVKWIETEITRETYLIKEKSANDELSQVIHKLLIANQKLEQFVYASSHDLRSPLKLTISALKELEKDIENGDLSTAANTIHAIYSRLEKMISLLSTLLLFAKSNQESPYEGSSDKIKISKMVEEIMEIIEISPKTSVIVDENLNTYYASKMPIYQILLNLISNATKFVDPNKGIIEIGVKTINEETACFVKDNGPGIDKENQSKVFNMLETLGHPHGGTGIGLGIIKQHILNQKGKIWIESEQDVGTTFYFTLPQITQEVSHESKT